MRLVHVHWAPLVGLADPLPHDWPAQFEQWLDQEFQCKIIRDSGKNWRELEFQDNSRATEFVLRFG